MSFARPIVGGASPRGVRYTHMLLYVWFAEWVVRKTCCVLVYGMFLVKCCMCLASGPWPQRKRDNRM